MEPYSSDGSRERREDSHGCRPTQTSQIAGTESPFTNLTSTNTSRGVEANLGTTSSAAAVGLYHPLDAQNQPSRSENQASNSRLITSSYFDQYSRLSRQSYSTPSLARHSSLSQGTTFQSCVYPDPGEQQSPTLLQQANRSLEQDHSTQKTQYSSGPQESLQANMMYNLRSRTSSIHRSTNSCSIMGPHYFSGIENSLNRSSYTWPVFEQTHNDSSYLQPFDEQIVTPRPQTTSTTPPSMMSMSLPTQRESRQLHQVRRNSKTRFRRERSHSNSYNPSLSTTPEAVPRTLALCNYPLLPPTSGPPQSSMPVQQFSSSLQLSEPLQTEIYGQQYPIGMTDYSGNYLASYSPAPIDPTSSFPFGPHPTSSISNPDLETYYRQPSASNIIRNQSHAHDQGGDAVRVVLTRPKPQCWEHGCNGRAFSTFSNLLRHQREKNGVASKPTCPHCGAEFTRTTARNGHMQHEKCKKA